MKMLRSTASLLAAAVMATCPPAGAQPKVPPEIAAKSGIWVSPEEIARDIVGKTWESRNSAGIPMTFWMTKDGTAHFRARNNGDGTWRPSEDGYCTRYPNLRGGAEACFEVFRMPDGTYEAFESNNGVRIASGTFVRPR